MIVPPQRRAPLDAGPDIIDLINFRPRHVLAVGACGFSGLQYFAGTFGRHGKRQRQSGSSIRLWF
jgi:hypothetical protein